MDPEPRPEQSRPEPKAEAPAAPAAQPSPDRRRRDPRTPGEAYTPMPDFREPPPKRWRYLAAAAILALALALGYVKLHRAPTPAPQLAPLEQADRP